MNDLTVTETQTLAAAMHKSGYFPDLKNADQALVKIAAGREFGLGPWAAITQIHIVQGRPTLGANMLAAMVKRSGKYDYTVQRLDDEACELVVTQDGKPCGPAIAYTTEDAKKADLLGKDNWKKYRQDMLFARAITRAVRRHCPDVTAGIAAYVPDELEPAPEAPVHVPAEVVTETVTTTVSSEPAPVVVVNSADRDAKVELYRGILRVANELVNPQNDATLALGLSKRVAIRWEEACRTAGLDPTLDAMTLDQVARIAAQQINEIKTKMEGKVA